MKTPKNEQTRKQDILGIASFITLDIVGLAITKLPCWRTLRILETRGSQWLELVTTRTACKGIKVQIILSSILHFRTREGKWDKLIFAQTSGTVPRDKEKIGRKGVRAASDVRHPEVSFFLFLNALTLPNLYG